MTTTTFPFPTDVLQFVLWLGINGLTIVALLEKIPAWATLKPQYKAVGVFVFLVGGPVLSELLGQLVATVPTVLLGQIQHYVDLFLIGLKIWAASQYAHGGVRYLVALKK